MSAHKIQAVADLIALIWLGAIVVMTLIASAKTPRR
jgi:hypothetical protein